VLSVVEFERLRSDNIRAFLELRNSVAREANEAYDKLRDPEFGVVDNILRIHGVHSRVMRLHYDLYIELMRRPGPLTRVQREMLATAVSAANGCHY